jgi:hypothetical protein
VRLLDHSQHGMPTERGPLAIADSPGDIRKLLSEVKVEMTSEGGMTIQAPPEAASTLAALFQGLAGMLQNAAPRS